MIEVIESLVLIFIYGVGEIEWLKKKNKYF